MSNSGFRSTLEVINFAYSEDSKISQNFRHIEIGKLYEIWQNRRAAIASGNYLEEAEIIPKLYHENIIPFYSADQYIKYDIIGRLNYYLRPSTLHNERQNFTWAQRLRICLGVAKGLRYLHSGVEDHGRVIHGNFDSRNVLLDENMEARLCGLHYSVLVRGNQPHPEIYRPTFSGTCSIDPVYQDSNILNIESDIYSYGILMFEILTRMDPAGKLGGEHNVRKMIQLALRFHDDGPEQLIDPDIINDVDHRSFHMFIDTAYKCISLNIKDRPTMHEIVKTIEEALEIHNQQAVSAIAKRRNPADSLEKFQISLEEILKATKNFSEETQIKKGDDIVVIYKGHLSDRLQKRTVAIKQYLTDKNFINVCKFFDELKMFSMLHHENIAPFIGYFETQESYDVNHRFIVSEYAVNGSLYNQLKDPNINISWAQRLKICIGAAKGLLYLHSGFGEYKRVIHGDFSSRKILLYENLEAKICGFSRSLVLPGWGPAELVGDKYYMDPAYRQSHIRDKESDVYSYGVVLFEILTGMLACDTRPVGEEESLNLVALVRRYYTDQLDKLLDLRIRDEIDDRSFYTFKEIAYKCISFNVKDRPSLNKIVKRLEDALYIQNGAASNNTGIFKKLEDSLIRLKDINLAIGVEGQETVIAKGGSVVIYKGWLSERWQNRTVAIKCLLPQKYQGENEFRYELNLIFSFNHKNIIPFIGYCDEGNKKIIVYEYANKGSLDCHINDKNMRRCLTWEHRLKICLGAAQGLDYLHSGLGEDKSVIHRDVKSANILLDHNLVAKICDFGLSKSGLVNQPIYSNVAGTNFYMDPIYHEGGILRKESDVYSFGVVMFELLSGILAFNRRKLKGGKKTFLINNVRRYYDYKPELLIDPLIKDKIDSRSFDTYSKVAFQCISFNSKERPTMEMIVDRIEEALEFHVSKQRESQAKGDAEHPGSLE